MNKQLKNKAIIYSRKSVMLKTLKEVCQSNNLIIERIIKISADKKESAKESSLELIKYIEDNGPIVS